MTRNTGKTIVVAGDVWVERLQWTTGPKNQGLNWELSNGLNSMDMPGGASLLADFLEKMTEDRVLMPVPGKMGTSPEGSLLYSNLELDFYPVSTEPRDKNSKVYRVKSFRGYSGVSEGTPAVFKVEKDDPGAELLILNDSGNGFRDSEAAWPLALKEEENNPVILYKMKKPLFQGKLWERLRKYDPEKLIVILDADDLRADGINISRCLSWERTATDFVWQLVSNRKLLPLACCHHLLVLFGLEGAIYHSTAGGMIQSRLFFDPVLVEEGFRNKHPGEMRGEACAFTAALGAVISSERYDSLKQSVIQGIPEGITAARRLYRNGFGSLYNQPRYPDFAEASKEEIRSIGSIAQAIVPNPVVPEPADPAYWCILKEIKGSALEEMAGEIVLKGTDKALKSIPVGIFGKLSTADRYEIESFRSIKNLMSGYISASNPPRPLSIAVFGSPGSGKSFGVTEIAEDLAPGMVLKLEFNVSQLSNPAELIIAFHKVRDAVLKGKIPLVFFDEFDSAYEGKLGWLKYFLAPMQDGAFRDGETMHPIGKAIFVFAGGTSSTFQAFCGEKANEQEKDQVLSDFRNAKGPDFVSRLRGYVNIMGPNPVDDRDSVYVIRRAMLLRSLLERKARYLFDSENCARVDEGVLRALLKVPCYKHGARSMEAILDMSSLNGQESWEQALLPPKGQLGLHMDEEMFLKLVVRDVLFGASREILAQAIHEKYREEQAGKRASEDSVMRPWKELDESLRESNRDQADHIPGKLKSIGCGFMPVEGKKPKEFVFTPQEVEFLAKQEHERFVTERRLGGWVYGECRDSERKISPYLIPWEDLTEEIRDLDRQAVSGMPGFLAKAGFEIYRLV